MSYLDSSPKKEHHALKHKNFKDLRERQAQLNKVEEFVSIVKSNNALIPDDRSKDNPYIDRIDRQISFCRSVIDRIKQSGFKAHLFPIFDSAWSDLKFSVNLAAHYQTS